MKPPVWKFQPTGSKMHLDWNSCWFSTPPWLIYLNHPISKPPFYGVFYYPFLKYHLYLQITLWLCIMNYIEPLKELMCVFALKCMRLSLVSSPTQLVSTQKKRWKNYSRTPRIQSLAPLAQVEMTSVTAFYRPITISEFTQMIPVRFELATQ